MARPSLPCAMAPVPEAGLPEHTCPDWEPEPEPDPEPHGRMLFEADGHAELDPFECTDTPDERLAQEAKKLSLPGPSCTELRAAGACELEMVKDLCPKACNAFGHRKGRRLDKCTGG